MPARIRANTKAAYRFFANGRVEESDILSGRFAATRARCDASDGPILLIQDATEFSSRRASVSAVGVTKTSTAVATSEDACVIILSADADAFELGGNDQGCRWGWRP